MAAKLHVCDECGREVAPGRLLCTDCFADLHGFDFTELYGGEYEDDDYEDDYE